MNAELDSLAKADCYSKNWSNFLMTRIRLLNVYVDYVGVQVGEAKVSNSLTQGCRHEMMEATSIGKLQTEEYKQAQAGLLLTLRKPCRGPKSLSSSQGVFKSLLANYKENKLSKLMELSRRLKKRNICSSWITLRVKMPVVKV